MLKRQHLIQAKIQLLNFFDAYLFWILPCLNIILIRWTVKYELYLALPLISLLLTGFSIFMAFNNKQRLDQVRDTSGQKDIRRRRLQWIFTSLMLILSSWHQYKQIYSAQVWLEKILNSDQESQVIDVTVDSVSENAWNALDLIVKTEDGYGIRCRIEEKKIQNYSDYKKISSLAYGDRLILPLEFSAIEKAQNPGAFNANQYYQSQGIFVDARIAEGGEIEFLEYRSPFSSFQRQADRLNERISSYFLDEFGENLGAIAAAMFLGNEEHISKSIKDDFKASSLSHLLVVSGSNVSLVFTFMMPVLERSGMKWTYRQALLLPALIAFAYLIRWDASVTRAVAMNLVLILSRLMKRPIRASTALALAVNFIIVFQVRAAVQTGFLMSAAVSFVLMEGVNPIVERLLDLSRLNHSWRRKYLLMEQSKQKKIKQVLMAVITPVLSQLAVMPFAIEMGSMYSWIGIPINWLAGPLAAALSIMLTIISPLAFISPELSSLLIYFIRMPVKTLLLSIERLAALPRLCSLSLRSFTDTYLYFYLFLIIFLLAIIKRWKWKRFIYVNLFALCLTCTMLVTNYICRAELSIYFLSVGQGDAALLQFKNGQTILIDTGTDKEGMAVIPAALQALNIRMIDLVIVSHFDQDHVGALASLIEEDLLRSVISPPATTRLGRAFEEERAYQKSLESLAEEKGISWQYLQAGDRLQFSEKQFIDCIYPASNDPKGGNDSSLVLHLQSGLLDLLFTGDLEAKGEQYLLQTNALMDVDVLKLAHHGSKTSSSPAFLDAIDGELALISVGKNTYGHPFPAVLQSLEERDYHIFRTDLDGAFVIESRKDGWQAYRYRERNLFWKGK